MCQMLPIASILTSFTMLPTPPSSNCSLLTDQGYKILAEMQTGGIYFSYLVNACNLLQPAICCKR